MTIRGINIRLEFSSNRLIATLIGEENPLCLFLQLLLFDLVSSRKWTTCSFRYWLIATHFAFFVFFIFNFKLNNLSEVLSFSLFFWIIKTLTTIADLEKWMSKVKTFFFLLFSSNSFLSPSLLLFDNNFIKATRNFV